MGNGASLVRKNSNTDGETRSTFIKVIDSSNSIRSISMDEARLVTVPKSEEIKSLINEALKGKFMFATLKSAQLVKLIDVFKPVSCKKGEKIIEQGAVGDYMYVIESGHFEVTKEGQGKLTECTAGHTFGELALIYNAQRSATVTCTKDAKLWALDRQTFRHFQTSEERITEVVGNILCKVPLLKDLERSQISMAAEVAKTVDYKEGDVIIAKGEIGNTFFIVLEGIVNCSEADLIEAKSKDQVGTKNSSRLLQASLPAGGARLKAGEWFGEIALLTGSVRTANVVADSPVKLVAFDRDAFEKVLGSLKDIIDKEANNRMLSDLPIIARLPPDRREAAVDMFTIEKFENGQVMAQCGDAQPRFLLMKSGKALVWKHPNPQELVQQKAKEDARKKRGIKPSKHSNHRQISPGSVKSTATGGGGDDTGSLGFPDVSPANAAATPTVVGGDFGNKFEAQVKVNNELKESTPTSATSASGASGVSVLRARRSMLDITQDSIDALTEFEMPTMSVLSFSDTLVGKQEALWRKIMSADPEKGTKAKKKRISDEADIDTSPTVVSVEVEKDDNIHKEAEIASATSNTADISEDELKAVRNMANSGELKGGDTVGAEAVINGAPMDCTVISLGSTSCFVLTRGDLLLLLEDGGDEGDAPKNFEAKLKSLESALSASNKVSYTDVMNTTEEVDWSSLKNLGKLGAGTFGTVYMMTDKNDQYFAMKVLDKKKVKEMKQDRRVRTEKQLLLSMNSPFICKCFGVNQDSDGFYFLLELVTGGELKRLIHPADREKRSQQHQDAISGKVVGIPHQPAKFYVAAISIPLKYLHRRMIAFRDLKPENVMIDRFGYPKLIDFGLAKPLDDSGKTYTLCGTPEFLAPEVIMGHGHNQAVDWWALGVLLYEMIVGVSPFIDRAVARNKQDQMTVFENIVENKVVYPDQLEPKCQDLIQRLLTVKPAFRMGCGHRAHKEFQEHDWFKGVVDWYALNKRQVSPPWFPPEEE